MVRDCHVSRTVDVTYFRSGSAGSRLRPEDLDLSAIRQARVLAISGVTAALSDTAFEATLAAAQAAREAGVTVVFDPNIRYKLAPIEAQIGGLRQLARYADVLLAAEDEAMVISGKAGADDGLAEWFLAGGCRRSPSSSAARPGHGQPMARTPGISRRSVSTPWIQ